MARKYLIETFGCQMNVHDSERMAGLLEQAGFEAADDAADADVVVINTCSVRERAEDKLYTRLGELRQLASSRGTIGSWRSPAASPSRKARPFCRRAPAWPTSSSGRRRSAGCRCSSSRRPSRRAHVRCWTSTLRRRDVSARRDSASDPVKAYVTIIEGCNEFCSFCVVPYTRGHERMRPKADILAEVREAAATGRREVQLLGQIVNHYVAPDDPRLRLSPARSRRFTTSMASSASGSPARIRGM